MASAEERFGPIRSFFAGAYGDDLYGNFVLAGSEERERADLDVFVALYGPGQIEFFSFVLDQLDPKVTYRILQRYELTDEQRANQYTQLVDLAPGDDSTELNGVLWQLGMSRVAPHGLPLAFLTYLRPQSGGQDKVVFWYSRMAPADWQLAQLKDAALTEIE